MNIFKRFLAFVRGVSLEDPGPYSSIRAVYKYEVKNAILGYLVDDSTNPVKYRNQMAKAMVTAFKDAFDRGYIDGGGSTSEMEQSDRDWVYSKQITERGFINQLFDRLKELKKEEPDEDNTGEADARSESYSTTLDGVYSEGVLRGNKNQMLTFDGDDGEESCPECRKLKGKRHSSKWWVNRGLIPGQPGNQNYTCRGYNCHHYLYNDSGEIIVGH